MSRVYANGTLVNLNGTSYSKKTASLFAPIESGNEGNFLQSNGANKAPSWIDAQTARGNLGFSGAVTSIISQNLKQDRVLVSSDSGKVIVSDMPVDTLMGLEGKITGAVGALEASIAGIKSGIEADINTKIDALDSKKEDKINILPITKGGTGAKSFTSGQVLVGNGTNAFSTKAITDSNQTTVTLSSASTNLVSERAVNGAINTAIANLVDSAPSTLNTLNKLATALGENENSITTILEEIGKKENAFSVLPIAKGGTGASGFTQNRPLFYNGTYLTSSSHYIEGQKLGVNTIYAPNQPFFVNGQVHFASGHANSCTTGTIHLPTYYRGSASTYITFDLGKRDKSRMIMIEIKGNGYSGGYPIHSMYQFYNFIQNGTWSILAYKGRCYGDPTGPLKIYYKEVTNDDGTTETRLMACLCPFLDANGNVVTSNDSQTLDISIQYSVSHLDKVTMTTGTSDPSSDDSITILQTITPVDAVPISNGGTGATSFTSNAILRYNGEKLVSTNNYVADSKLAIGSASAPDENLYVNGTSKITGAATVKTLTISDNAGSSHIKFSRNNGINYLHVPTGGSLGVCIGDLSTDNCPFVVKSDMVFPYKTNTIGLGSTSYKWKHLYLGTGGLYTGGTIYPSTENSCNIGSASYIWKYMYGERYYAYDATNKYQGGSFYTANSASTTAQPTYLILGNSTTTGTAGNRYGILRLYGTGANYTTIQRPAEATEGNYTLNLPGANGQLVYHTNDTAIGSASLPVYIASTGRATACTASSIFSALSWTGGTSAGPVLNATVATQSKTAQIPSASTTASGVVTTGPQTFAGNKTFTGQIFSDNSAVEPQIGVKGYNGNIYFYSQDPKNTTKHAGIYHQRTATLQTSVLYVDENGSLVIGDDGKSTRINGSKILLPTSCYNDTGTFPSSPSEGQVFFKII